MLREIITYNSLEGYHAWPEAPAECDYLRARHRHLFVIRTWMEVTHNDRDLEINIWSNAVKKALEDRYGSPCEFGSMSCESIAQMILTIFPVATRCEVLEDGYAGASLSR